ncbi:MAG: hypothetical protein JOY54_09095 [Acidobacteriaceae bacterium]|nr:hypothetical protein [Acidobacteriaceae bacterium]
MSSIPIEHRQSATILIGSYSEVSDISASRVRNRWFVLRVRPRHEKSVSRMLENLGHITFLPLFTRRHTYGQRLRKFQLPLFPGYVFLYCDPSRSTVPSRIPSVLGWIHSAGKPLPVEEEEIRAIQIATAKRIELNPCPYVRVGDVVRIAEGPLAGIAGKIRDTKNKSMELILSIEILQRSVMLEIDRTSVQAT